MWRDWSAQYTDVYLAAHLACIAFPGPALVYSIILIPNIVLTGIQVLEFFFVRHASLFLSFSGET